MTLEILTKFLIILVLTVAWGATVRFVWVSHIDPKATIQRFFSETVKPPNWIATRDPTKLYQNDKVVGDVSGEVQDLGDKVLFREISNTGTLDRNAPFEYQRKTLRIRSIRVASGMKVSPSGSKSNVLEDVMAEVVR